MFIERYRLWSEEQRAQAKEVQQRLKQEDLELILLRGGPARRIASEGCLGTGVSRSPGEPLQHHAESSVVAARVIWACPRMTGSPEPGDRVVSGWLPASRPAVSLSFHLDDRAHPGM